MSFIVASGQLKKIASDATVASWGWGQPQSVMLTPQLAMTYQQIWRAQPQLRTVVGFLARNVGQLALDVYHRVSDTSRVKLVDHPAARLLRRPFPDTKFTRYRLFNGVMHDLCIYDNAFLLKVQFGGEPALLPVAPTNIIPKGTTWSTATQYIVRGDVGEKTVDAEQVVHLHGYTPGDARQGTSPIETLRQILAEEYSATQYREQLWRNGARVAGYLRRPKDAPRWSDDGRARFKTDWQAQYVGDGPQSGGTPVLEDGMEFVASGVSPKDAQYVESRKLTREEVAVAFYVSPAMVGMTEHANFSSIRELHQMLYQDTLPPFLTQIQQDLENQLLADLDPRGADGEVYMEFNINEKLRGSFEEQSRSFQSAVGGPWMTRNEARARLNLSGIDGADELIVPLNVVEGGLASPNDTAPNDPSTDGNPKALPPGTSDDRAVLWRLYQRQQQSVLSRLGAGKAVLFDRGRWDGELASDLIEGDLVSSRDEAESWAAQINDHTEGRLAPALMSADPFAAVRDVFSDLARDAT
jgi:HK97 family phage portal protein